MADDIPRIDDIDVERAPGFLSVFDPQKFRDIGLTPLTELKKKYVTMADMKAAMDGLKNRHGKLNKEELLVKAEMGGILLIAGQSALAGNKTGLAERNFGLNKNTGYTYIKLYKLFPWGWDAARDAAIIKSEKDGVDVSITIDDVLKHGEEEAIKAGAVEKPTFSGAEVMLIDPSQDAENRVKMSIIPSNFANRKGSKAGFWVPVEGGVSRIQSNLLWKEISDRPLPYFTLCGTGFENRLVIGRIDIKTKKISPIDPKIAEVQQDIDFSARRPQKVRLPRFQPSTRRIIWEERDSDAPLDADKVTIRELGEPLVGTIAFQEESDDKHSGFFDLGGQQLNGDWTLASLGDGGILIRPNVESNSMLYKYVTWTSADALEKLQKTPAPDDGERWDVLDVESIKSEFNLDESPFLTQIRMAKLIDKWKANDPTDLAINEGYARHHGDEVEWNIAKVHEALTRTAGYAMISFDAMWKSDYLVHCGLIADMKATQKAVDDGIALAVDSSAFHTERLTALYATEEALAFKADHERKREDAAAEAKKIGPAPEGSLHILFKDDNAALGHILRKLGYLDDDDNPTEAAFTEKLAVRHGDQTLWLSEKVENRINQPDAVIISEFDTELYDTEEIRFLIANGYSTDEGSGTEKAKAEGLVQAVGDGWWHGQKLNDRMKQPDAVAFLAQTDEGAKEAAKEPDQGDDEDEDEEEADDTAEEAEPASRKPWLRVVHSREEPLEENNPAKIAENIISTLGRIETLAIHIRTLRPTKRNIAQNTRKIEDLSNDALDMLKELLKLSSITVEDNRSHI